MEELLGIVLGWLFQLIVEITLAYVFLGVGVVLCWLIARICLQSISFQQIAKKHSGLASGVGIIAIVAFGCLAS